MESVTRFLVFCSVVVLLSYAVVATTESKKATTSSQPLAIPPPWANGSSVRFSHGRLWFKQVEEHQDGGQDVAQVQAFHFDQVLDHFNPSGDSRRWKQRYWLTKQFWKSPHGPVFLILDGERETGPNNLVGSFYYTTLAKELGALMFLVEHRFYGKSHPTVDASVENLKYLNTHQALKDLQHFVATMKRKHNLQHNKWMSYGGSYAGSLSAWLRLKFPETVDMAWATSAPVELKTDFRGYFETITNSLFVKHSQACVDAFRNATLEIRRLTKGGDSDWQHLIRTFNLCPLEKTTLNIQSVYANLSSGVKSAVQYNEDQFSPGVVGIFNMNIRDICGIMTNEENPTTTPIQRYANVLKFTNRMRFGITESDGCNDFSYESFIKYMRADQWSSDAVVKSTRQWIYQTCNEWGAFQTSYFSDQSTIFGDIPLEHFYQTCRDIYGPRFMPARIEAAVKATREFYGGRAGFEHITKIILVNGKIDPWSASGVLNGTGVNPGSTVLYMSDTAHKADCFAATQQDSVPLQFGHALIRRMVKRYLGLDSTMNTLQPQIAPVLTKNENDGRKVIGPALNFRAQA